jgi:hypothetical protein
MADWLCNRHKMSAPAHHTNVVKLLRNPAVTKGIRFPLVTAFCQG